MDTTFESSSMFVYAYLFTFLAYCGLLIVDAIKEEAVREAALSHASAIVTQLQQIQDSAERYKADKGEYPVALQELVSQNFLKPPLGSSDEQVRQGIGFSVTAWVAAAPKVPVYALLGATAPVCKAINLLSFGDSYVPLTARATDRAQCYGEHPDSLKVLLAKTPADLIAASSHPAAVTPIGPALPAPAAGSAPSSHNERISRLWMGI